jgi:hypothetical protein
MAKDFDDPLDEILEPEPHLANKPLAKDEPHFEAHPASKPASHPEAHPDSHPAKAKAAAKDEPEPVDPGDPMEIVTLYCNREEIHEVGHNGVRYETPYKAHVKVPRDVAHLYEHAGEW